MELSAKVSGVWTTITNPQVKISGTWTNIQEGWVRVSGTWQQFFAYLNAAITDTSSLGNSEAGYRLNSSGHAEVNTNSGAYSNYETWLIAGANTDFECRATLTAGDALSTGTTGTWLGLSGTRTWTRSSTLTTFHSSTLLIEIRRVSDSIVITSATIYLEADNT